MISVVDSNCQKSENQQNTRVLEHDGFSAISFAPLRYFNEQVCGVVRTRKYDRPIVIFVLSV